MPVAAWKVEITIVEQAHDFGHGAEPQEHLEHKPQTGLRRPGDRTGPRVHDFRHRFAIRTLLDWHREGKNVEQQLPALSTYLGHACVRDTYWYLSACPELMEEAVRRLDRRWEATP